MSNELISSWVFWYSSLKIRSEKFDLASNYETELLPICEIKSLQDFFNAYSYLYKLSEMPRGVSISFFRKGLKPMWESSPSGGCWMLKITKHDNFRADAFFEALLIECIRGGFSEDVDGVMASCKNYEISIQIWMHEAAAAKAKVAEEIKTALKVETIEMYLKYHRDSLKDLSTSRNSVRVTL